jgi:cellulose synthase operon protein C
VQSFQKAEALAPNDIGVQTRLASVRVGMGQPDAAVDDLEHTLQLAPSQISVGDALFFAALATGDLDKAADALAKIKAAQGDTPSVANLDGLLKLSQLNLPAARQAFEAIVKQHPDFVPAQVNLARMMAMQGDNPGAEKLLAALVDKNATSEPALTMLVTLYRQTGQMPKAIAALERAHTATPDDVRLTTSLADLYIVSGVPQKALDLANSTKGVDTNAQLLDIRAAAQVSLKQPDAARDTYTQLLKLDPGAVGARRQLAALLIQSNDNESARGVIKSGLAASPRNYQLYQDLVMIDLKTGGVDAALATANQLQQQDRDFTMASALKGDIYMAADKPDDAAKAYADALAAAPSQMLLTRLASALQKAGHSDQAVQAFADWMAKHPDDIAIAGLMAQYDIAANRYDDAATQLKAVLAKKPHDPVALNNLAWIYQQQGNPAAQSLARQAYLLSPGPQTADTLGWIMTTSGQAPTGLVLLRQASAGSASDPRVAYHYAVALKDTGQRDEAIKQLNAVVAAKGDFAEKADAQKLLSDLSKGS